MRIVCWPRLPGLIGADPTAFAFPRGGSLARKPPLPELRCFQAYCWRSRWGGMPKGERIRQGASDGLCRRSGGWHAIQGEYGGFSSRSRKTCVFNTSLAFLPASLKQKITSWHTAQIRDFAYQQFIRLKNRYLVTLGVPRPIKRFSPHHPLQAIT